MITCTTVLFIHSTSMLSDRYWSLLYTPTQQKKCKKKFFIDVLFCVFETTFLLSITDYLIMFIRANLFDKIVGHSNVWSKYIYICRGRERWLKRKKKVQNNMRMSVLKSMKERSCQHWYRHVIPLTLCCSWSLCSVLCPPLSVQPVLFVVVFVSFCFVFPCLLYEVVFISIFVDWIVFFYFTYSFFPNYLWFSRVVVEIC